MGTLYISNLAGKVNDFFAILHMDKKHWFWQNRNEKNLIHRWDYGILN